MIERLAPLRRQGLLRSAIHIGNDLRLMSGQMRYPWHLTQGRTPLPEQVRAQLRASMKIAAWTGVGAIYGTPGTIAAVRRAIRRAMRPYSVMFLTDARLAALRRTSQWLSRVGLCRTLREQLLHVEPVIDLLKGRPTDGHLSGACWRVRGEAGSPALDPLEAGAGLMWASPVLPATGEEARNLMDLIVPIYAHHGFDAPVTFSMVNERALVAVTNVAFDRRDPRETVAAAACYEHLMNALIDAGYIPYRTGPQGVAKLHPQAPVFWDVTRRIRDALDPHDIMSPGRYIPQASPKAAA